MPLFPSATGPAAPFRRGTLLRIVLACSVLLPTAAAPAQRHTTDTSSPLTSIRDLLDAHRSQQDVLLRGAITYNGQELVVQDQTGAVAVSSPSPVSAALGDQVEVQGDFETRTGIAVVRNANVRILWPGSTPLPFAITPDEAAEGAYNGMLVAIEGELIKAITAPDGALRLTLDSGNQLFTCTLEPGAPSIAISLTPGSTLRCTGVLSFNQPERAFESGTFLVLLRNGTDVHLLIPAPWWTPKHLMLLFLLSFPMLALGVHLHTRSVRARMALIVEERSRIAREIHDTLAQGFAGIALQLQGVHRTMGKQSSATDTHLSMALQMVRRSRAEAHRSIATLRTLHTYEDLAVMVRKLLRQLAEPAQLELSVTQRGTPVAVSDEVTSHILRISQETIANTVEHAHARAVSVAITYTADKLVMEIQDDGHGFDPDTVASVESGHFGIAGMRERAQQIRAALSIRSGPEGTTLRLEIPVTRPSLGYARLLSKSRRRFAVRSTAFEGNRP